MKKKKKERLFLCFKYGSNCKFCPRNKKCEEEIERELNRRHEKNTRKAKKIKSFM